LTLLRPLRKTSEFHLPYTLYAKRHADETLRLCVNFHEFTATERITAALRLCSILDMPRHIYILLLKSLMSPYPQSPLANTWIIPRVSHYHFLPNLLHLTIPQSTYDSGLVIASRNIFETGNDKCASRIRQNVTL